MAIHKIVTPSEIMKMGTNNRRTANRGPTEDQIQKHFVAWLRAHGFNFFHVPNQLAARSKRHGAILKAMGVQAGVPDIVILDRPESPSWANYSVICIELKSAIGKPTYTQTAWRLSAERHRWWVGTCRGFDEAITLCKTIWPSASLAVTQGATKNQINFPVG